MRHVLRQWNRWPGRNRERRNAMLDVSMTPSMLGFEVKGDYGIRKQVGEGFCRVPDMYTQWLDVVNCDWCRLSADRRCSKLSTVVRDVSDHWGDQRYRDLKAGIDEYVRESGAARANVIVADVDYPDEYEW